MMADRRFRATSFVRETRPRRMIYAALILMLGVLCVWPTAYVARAKMLPQDSSSVGLGQIISSLGGQLSNFATLLTGGRPPNDLYLVIGRSDPVADDVIADLKLVGPGRKYERDGAAKRALDDKVDVHLLLGGVIEVETKTHDRDEALSLTHAYVRAISKQIGELGRQTIKSKTEIVGGRFKLAAKRVSETSAALDDFRRANRLASFEVQLGSAITLRADLQSRLQAKLVELQTIQQVAGPESVQLHSVETEIASLREEIAKSGRSAAGTAGPNAEGLSALQSRYLDLYRDYRFAESLYDVYSRGVEQTEIESLVSQTATYIQIVEPAHLDAVRHYNIPAVALLAAVVLLALFTELYAPATGLQWSALLVRSDSDDLV